MKKTVTLLAVLFLTLSTLAAKENLFSLSAGLSTGYSIYSSDEIKEYNSSISGSHVLIGGMVTGNLNPFKEVTFFIGADLLTDFISAKNVHSNHMHLDFPLGVKIYPGIGGLCGGLAYTIGFRYDSIEIGELEIKESTPWGNGFKIFLEYNFAHNGSSKYYPTIGTSWKYMPRGNKTSDNLLSAYICINL